MSAIKRVKDAIEEIKKGKMVIMLDDEDRENEGDLVYSAALSDDQKVNFMATHAKGLICVAVSKAAFINTPIAFSISGSFSNFTKGDAGLFFV